MYCSKCGTPLIEGKLYCPKCGKAASMISDLDTLEDDFLREMIDDEKISASGSTSLSEDSAAGNNIRPSVQETQSTEPSPKAKETGTAGENTKPKTKAARENAGVDDFSASSNQKTKKSSDRKKKKNRRALLVLLVLLAAAAAVCIGTTVYRRSHSTEYLLSKAEAAFADKDYTGALAWLDKVLALEEDNTDALLLAGQINTLMKDYDTAQTQLLAVIEADPLCIDAYSCLLTIYESAFDTESILALIRDITDEEILALFADYVVLSPEVSVESGTYSEYFSVEITSENEDAVIYYTLDGSEPTEESEVYEEEIEFSEEGEFVLTAVCVNENGIYSEMVTAEYLIELDTPDMPIVSPDGGYFTETTTVTVTVPSGCTVYYTWDGSTPGTGSSKYTGPLTVPEGNNILSLVAIDSNGKRSEVVKCNFIYYPASSQEEEEDTSADAAEDTSADPTEDTSGDT